MFFTYGSKIMELFSSSKFLLGSYLNYSVLIRISPWENAKNNRLSQSEWNVEQREFSRH
jgi:hypothetical protein